MWHNVHSQQHTYVSSSYRSNRLGLSQWNSYAAHRGSCLELYYCNMVEWFWWDSSLISTTNWFPSVLWHCWFGHLACGNRPRNGLLCVVWDVKPYTLADTWIPGWYLDSWVTPGYPGQQIHQGYHSVTVMSNSRYILLIFSIHINHHLSRFRASPSSQQFVKCWKYYKYCQGHYSVI